MSMERIVARHARLVAAGQKVAARLEGAKGEEAKALGRRANDIANELELCEAQAKHGGGSVEDGGVRVSPPTGRLAAEGN